MTLPSDDSTKAAIRKRMFFAVEDRGESGMRFGFQWCSLCRGQGEICNERSIGGVHTAAFEICTNCKGERILAIQPPANNAGA